MEETKSPSPNGQYLFQISIWEARMSHWVESPRLIDTKNSQSLFDLSRSNWSLDSAEWLDEEQVEIQLRRYPGDHTPPSFKVLIDCPRKEATVDGGNQIRLALLESALEEIYRRSRLNKSF